MSVKDIMEQETLQVRDEPSFEDNSDSIDSFEHLDSETPELGDIDYKLLKQLLEKRVKRLKKEQTSEVWAMNSSQIKLRQNEDFLNEQSNVIVQLQSKTYQLLQQAEKEAYFRSKVEQEMEKVKKNIRTFRNFYGTFKMMMEKGLTTKNKLLKLYKESLKNIDCALKEKTNKLTSCAIKLGKARKMYNNEQEKCATLEKINVNIRNDGDNEIGVLKIEQLKLTDVNKELREKYNQLLEEMKRTLKDKKEIFQELTIFNENCEKLVENYKCELDSVNNSLSNIVTLQFEDKKTIEKLKTELTDYETSLNAQNDYVDELLKKNEAVENSFVKLEQENENFKKSVNDYKIELNITRDTMSHDLTVAQNNCMEFEDSIFILRRDYSHIKQDYETAKDTIMTVTKNMEEKQENVNRLEELLVEMKTNLTNLQNEKENNAKEIQEMSESQKKLEEKYNTTITNLQDRYDNIFIETENLKEKREHILQEKDMVKKSSEEKMNIIRKESERKTKEIIDHNETYKNELEKIRQNETTKHSKEISKLTETIKTLELQINELKTSKQFLQNELNQKIHENVHLVNEKEKFKKLEKNPETTSSSSYQFKEPKSDVMNENIDEESKPTVKRTFMNKIRDPLPWSDSWSDSSIENEYVGRAWKPKLPDAGNRHVPPKRKTALNEDAQRDMDNMFNSLRPQPSTSVFQHPSENKMAKKSRANRKPLRMD